VPQPPPERACQRRARWRISLRLIRATSLVMYLVRREGASSKDAWHSSLAPARRMGGARCLQLVRREKVGDLDRSRSSNGRVPNHGDMRPKRNVMQRSAGIAPPSGAVPRLRACARWPRKRCVWPRRPEPPRTKARRHRDEMVGKAAALERALENERAVAEAWRKEAERLRESSELLRQRTETSRIRAELRRSASEEARSLREDVRKAEALRRSSELKRAEGARPKDGTTKSVQRSAKRSATRRGASSCRPRRRRLARRRRCHAGTPPAG